MDNGTEKRDEALQQGAHEPEDENTEAQEKDSTNYTGMFMPIGTGLGVSFGIIFDNLAIGIAIGTALGLMMGAIADAMQKKK